MKKIQLRTMAAVFGGVVLCVLLPFGSTLADVIVGVSPDEAVKFADVIVVGKLTDIEKRVFSLTTTKFGPALKPPTVWYDVGLIKDPRFLKGERLHNRVPQEREIAG